MKGERVAGGVRCGQVLERLPDLLDGVLAAEAVREVHAHLAECHRCERFGGAYGAVVAALREGAADAPALTPAFRAGLRRRLDGVR